MVFIGTGHGGLAMLSFVLFAICMMVAFVVIGRAVTRFNRSDAFKRAKPDFYFDKSVSPFSSRTASESGDGWTCGDPLCRAVNPDHGHFCRLCGSPRTQAPRR